MATAKKAAVPPANAPAKALATVPKQSPPTGQTYEERVAAGRKELAIWLNDEDYALLQQIQKRLNLAYPKQAIVQAIRTLYKAVMAAPARG